MRDHILSEIRRLAGEQNGKPPGKLMFERQTGIREHQWHGKFWARWGDAVADAGYERNKLQVKHDQNQVLNQIIQICRYIGHVPTFAEMKLYCRDHLSCCDVSTIQRRFATKAGLCAALARYAALDSGLSDVTAMLPSQYHNNEKRDSSSTTNQTEGFVYMLKSGSHFKIGRSEQIERRIKEIRIALPEAVELVHSIRTDDPSGIESYWHKRFADRRKNGEWFKLDLKYLAAFKKRKYQ